MLSQPWIWFAAALILASIEVLAPGYVFLGIAIGAGATGGVIWVLGAEVGLVQSQPLLVLVCAVLSLIAWLVLRRVLGVRKGQIKTFDRDINED